MLADEMSMHLKNSEDIGNVKFGEFSVYIYLVYTVQVIAIVIGLTFY